MISGSVRAALRPMSSAVITRVPTAVPSARSGKRLAVTTTGSRVSWATTGLHENAATNAAVAHWRLDCMARSSLPARVPAAGLSTWRTAAREERGGEVREPRARPPRATPTCRSRPVSGLASRDARRAFPPTLPSQDGRSVPVAVIDVGSLAYRCGGSTGFRVRPVTCFPFHPAGRETRAGHHERAGIDSSESPPIGVQEARTPRFSRRGKRRSQGSYPVAAGGGRPARETPAGSSPSGVSGFTKTHLERSLTP